MNGMLTLILFPGRENGVYSCWGIRGFVCNSRSGWEGDDEAAAGRQTSEANSPPSLDDVETALRILGLQYPPFYRVYLSTRLNSTSSPNTSSPRAPSLSSGCQPIRRSLTVGSRGGRTRASSHTSSVLSDRSLHATRQNSGRRGGANRGGRKSLLMIFLPRVLSKM